MYHPLVVLDTYRYREREEGEKEEGERERRERERGGREREEGERERREKEEGEREEGEEGEREGEQEVFMVYINHCSYHSLLLISFIGNLYFY